MSLILKYGRGFSIPVPFAKKYRLPDNSIIRKIFRLKDEQYYIKHYFFAVPLFITFIVSVVSVLVTVICLIANGLTPPVLIEVICLLVAVSISVACLIFSFVFDMYWNIYCLVKEMKYKKTIKHIKKEYPMEYEILLLNFHSQLLGIDDKPKKKTAKEKESKEK